ncbi:hypothetical protein NQZ68_025908 [Dissostichus eleginoides]|nr:hypothetical protein NQZ68_025908 [Dissostichus eleginoides]
MAEHWYRTSMGRANNFSKASSDVSIVTPPCPSTVSSLSRVHELTGPSLKRGVTVRERQHQPYPNEQVDDNQQRLSSTQCLAGLNGPLLGWTYIRTIWSVDEEAHNVEKALVVMFTVLPGGSVEGSARVAAHSFG